MKKNPTLLIDFYKAGHYFMQPEGVKTIYSTWTARSNKYHVGCPDTVVFGHQAFIKEYFIDFFNENFFNVPIDELRTGFNKIMKNCFNEQYADFTRFEKLYELGYLPIRVDAVPEGTLLPIRVPQAALWNTHPDFGWLPQYLEDMWSCHNWLPSTSATTAYYRRKDLEPYFEETCDDPSAVRRACGDFSMRGMTSEDAAYVSSAAHLLSFDRTATVDANGFLEQYYGADIENYPPGFGTPSLEHSVVCQGIAYWGDKLMNGTLNDEYRKIALRAAPDWEISLVAEMLFLYHLITKVQPKGVLSYVSDTNDYWGVLTKIAPALHYEILTREGKLVFRPDSGIPEKIVLGDPNSKQRHIQMGSVRVLQEEFGSKTNSKGYEVLNPCVGLIYGDAITQTIAKKIAEGLKEMRFSIENITFGIGAFTYQYVTRDTRGYAIKATNADFAELGEIPLYKSPKTDDGTKVSQRGCVVVYETVCDGIVYNDGYDLKHSHGGFSNYTNLLQPIFIDGEVKNTETIYDIRERLHKGGF